MGRARSRQRRQPLFQALAGTPGAAQQSRTFRPRLELLEDRVQPGDTILGLGAVALWGQGFTSDEQVLALDPGAPERRSHRGILSSLAEADSLYPTDFQYHPTGHESSRDDVARASAAEPGPGSVFPMCLEDGARAGQIAGYRFATPALPLSRALPADFDG